MKNTKMHWRAIDAALIAALFLGILLTGCGERPALTDTSTEANPISDHGLENESLWPEAPDETLGVCVDTPYINFYYPQELLDKIIPESTVTEDKSVTLFYAEISGKRAELFSIILGAEQDGAYLLGWLPDESGAKFAVSALVHEVDSSDWTDAEYSEICSLQERMNDIIGEIQKYEGFEPNR